MKRRRYLKPRRLVGDEELFRRRVQGTTLRELARDYGVAHTTLSRYLGRPEAKARLREVLAVLRLEERELRDESRRALENGRPERRADALGAAELAVTFDEGVRTVVLEEAAPTRPSAVERRPHRYPSDYADWLDDREYGRPPTCRERWSPNDETADKVVAAGGGIAAVVDATGLRTDENVRRLIDSDIVARADLNDAASSTVRAIDKSGPATVRRPGPWHQEVSPDAGEP